MVLERELFDEDAPCVDIIVVRRANICAVASVGMGLEPGADADAGEEELAAAWDCCRARCRSPTCPRRMVLEPGGLVVDGRTRRTRQDHP